MATAAIDSSTSPYLLVRRLVELSGRIQSSLSKAPPEPSSPVSVKSMITSLLSLPDPGGSASRHQILSLVKHFTLAVSILVSSRSSEHNLLNWIPQNLADVAGTCFSDVAMAYVQCFGNENSKKLGELGLDSITLGNAERLTIELWMEVFPELKDQIKESSIDKEDDITAASAAVPVGYAVVAAYQFRWFATQVDYPCIGKLCKLVIPCGLTALDHWSPEVKRQGVISLTHLGKRVTAAELGFYPDAILDACCHNLVAADEIWDTVVEMSAVFVSSTQQNNPRSPWFEKLLNEMLSHLERQPRNKERRCAWLKFIEPLLNAAGLVVLAHFRRIFPLLFLWMHADDDETVLLVLERTYTILRLTWIRNTPFVGRLVDELVALYKEAALRIGREEIRSHILKLFVLLQQSRGSQLEASWNKHRTDPDISDLISSFSDMSITA
ncbi:hypothetical protein MLD38_011128 [Melastoma candidum]|uniref:Uncharacterized protein n=1 Tax=Melastoma candidum TaxID=119954 RepID=A0ACB9R2L3_9MYRT|nr:hypothetical protein MLD38_011128 [Melastoma candidum]